MSDEVTIHVLMDIRDDVRAISSHLDQTNARIDKLPTREEIQSELHRVDIRMGETNVRLTDIQARLTELDLRHGTRMDELIVAFVGARDLETRMSRCERDIAMLSKPEAPK
jgi:hypothetical protein